MFCGPSMVFTNVLNPRSHVSRKQRVPADAGAARRDDRRQRDDRLRHDARRVRVRRRGRGRGDGRPGLRADGRRAGAAHRLDVPVRRAAAGQRSRAPAPRADRPTSRDGDGIRRTRRHRDERASRSCRARARRARRLRADQPQPLRGDRARSTGWSSSRSPTSIVARAQAVGAEQGVPAFGSLDEMLAAVPSDLVSICTPSGLHPQHGIVAARAGRHVLTEKPMAISLAAADELVQACDARGRASVRRQAEPAQSRRSSCCKRAVDKGRFGRIYSANVTVRWTRPQEYYDAEPWRGTWEFDGGAIMNQASHYVDLMQWLVGPVESVMAKTATQARRIEAEDSGVALLKFRSGALGVIEVTVLTYPRNLEGSITILGEKGSVKIGGTAVNRVEHLAVRRVRRRRQARRGGEHQPADRLRLRPRGLLPQRARGAARRGARRHGRTGGAQVARAHPRHLRVGEDRPRGAHPAPHQTLTSSATRRAPSHPDHPASHVRSSARSEGAARHHPRRRRRRGDGRRRLAAVHPRRARRGAGARRRGALAHAARDRLRQRHRCAPARPARARRRAAATR